MQFYRSTESPALADAARRTDRRRDVRHATLLQVAKLVSEAAEELCILRDISAGGAKAIVYCPVQVGARVVLVLKSAHELRGTVAWRTDDLVGITFDRRIAVLELLAHRARNRFGHRVRAPRVATDLDAMLAVDDTEVEVTIRDVSQAGMRIAVARLLQNGQECAVVVPAMGKRSAVVRWCRDGEAGLAFRQPMTYPEFATWRQALGVAMPVGTS